MKTCSLLYNVFGLLKQVFGLIGFGVLDSFLGCRLFCGFLVF